MKGKKWTIFLALTLVANLALASAASAADRCVLAELFTASS